MRALTKKNLLILSSIILTFALVQVLFMVGILNSFYEITIATICINIILAVSLNLVTGFTGQFSLGHAGFMSIGAYVCAIISMRMGSVGGFIFGMLAGALAAAFVGVLIGIPTLRLKGDYLAIATLGMAEIVRVVFLNLEITNGAAGLNGIPRYANWLWLFLFTVLAVVLINNFIKSSPGRACIAIREDEIAAESMGINTTKYKVIAFAIGAFFAGLAGGLYSSYFYFLKPDLFGFMKSVDILVIVVLGGLGSLTGSVIAAILLALITTFLQSFTAVRMIVYAALLVLIMIFRPQGLMGSKEINDILKFRFRNKDEKIE
ncbi:MAG: branched-chain amino acid ABC transporter permease [Eubacteriales bacterium]|nr:branched-chain amino acid ABC transporter permease [Eubacteriales bacterium]MDD3198866.1 branched-chain amino acid ABC transporter permease [Eubacteriales bacterium]MDD4629235.1 branched-chain amino acid ABC transporter permease [Eubacteriales bacterium]